MKKNINVLTLSFILGLILITSPNFTRALAQTNTIQQKVQQLTQQDIAVLTAKVDILSDINNRTLNSVYWTLGILAAIFLGLISVNLYFNITANKREILKIKEEIKNDTNVILREAKANIQTELLKANQLEIKEAAKNNLTTLHNEFLTYQASVNKRLEDFGQITSVIPNSIKKIEGSISKIEIDIKELEAFKYSQQGKMGGIINQIELLEYDINKRPWHIKYKLDDINQEIEQVFLSPELEKTLTELLDKIKEKEHQKIIGEIRGKIKLERKVEK